MRTVFENAEIPHLWAHGTQEHARNSGQSYWFDKGTLYSYREPIGRIVERKGQKIALFRDTTFSITTSRHQSRMRQAASHMPNFSVKHIAERYSDKVSHKENLADYHKRIETAALALKRARSSAEWRLTQLRHLVSEANEYAETFGYKTRFTVPTDTDVAALLERIEHENKKRARQIAKRAEEHRLAMIKAREEAQETIGEWLSGADVHIPGIVAEAYLRIDGEEAVTSKGARVPLEHIRRVLPIIKRLIERGEAYQRNGHTIHIGHYALDRIDTDGTVNAGCHTFKREEVLRFVGVLESTPEAATVA